jgi:hypothetical protein
MAIFARSHSQPRRYGTDCLVREPIEPLAISVHNTHLASCRGRGGHDTAIPRNSAAQSSNHPAFCLNIHRAVSFVDMPLTWTLLILSGLIYPAIYIAYRRRLNYKRLETRRILAHGSTFAAYAKAFSGESTPDQTADKLFDFYYVGRAYVLPLLLNILVTCGACAVVLIWFGWPLGLQIVEERAAHIPRECASALVGAYMWGLYDILQRCETIDLSPISLQYIWLRMLLAPALAPLIGGAFTDTLKPLLGFAIGTFPIAALQGSCPKSVIDDKHFRSNELRLGGLNEIPSKTGGRAISGNPKPSGCLQFRTSRNWCGFGSRAGTSTRG